VEGVVVVACHGGARAVLHLGQTVEGVVAEAADAAGHTAVTLHGLNEGAVVVVLITHGLSTVAALHQTVVGVVNEAAVDRAVRGAVAHGVISEGLGAGAKQPTGVTRDLRQTLFGIVGIA